MDRDDRETLIRIDERTRYLKERYDEDIPAMKRIVAKHEAKFSRLARDRWWMLAIAGVLWGGVIAFFDGIWEVFKK